MGIYEVVTHAVIIQILWNLREVIHQIHLILDISVFTNLRIEEVGTVEVQVDIMILNIFTTISRPRGRGSAR